MTRMLAGLAAALIFAFGALPAQAQVQKRDLAVPTTAGWKHAETGVILHSKVAGMQRVRVSDYGNAELDIAAELQQDEGRTWATVYIFHAAAPNVPIWFDRADTQVLMNQLFGNPKPVDAPRPFAPPRATTASGLRRAYLPGTLEFKGTALAVLPLGDWLVAVRITSRDLDPAQVDARLSDIIAGIVWPEGVAEAPAAVPVAACAAPLGYSKRAKLKPPSMNDALFGALLPAVAADETAEGKAKPAGPYCRDAASKAEYGVYRQADEPNAYVMALGDNGRTVSVAPSLSALVDKSPAFSVLYGDLDGSTSVYPSFNALPHPDKVLEALGKSAPISSTSKGGKNITISTPIK